jgi:DNA-binding transcriptional regulator YiaG
MTQRELIDRNGGATAVARRCNVTVRTAQRWKSGASKISGPARAILCGK